MNETDTRVRVAVADDHALFRDGLREILEADGAFMVVGEAGCSDEAVTVVTATRPDLVLLDVEMPGTPAAGTVERIMKESPSVKIVIVSMYDDHETVQELITLGVRGYLLKTVSRHELLAAIRGVLNDSERMILSISRSSLAKLNDAKSTVLSTRELEVLKLAAKAMSNAQIARELVVTEATVKRHLHNAFVKLGAVSRIDAANKAIAASLFSSDVLR